MPRFDTIGDFEIVSNITNREVIARGSGVDKLAQLRATFGGRNWRKYKGEATIELPGGRIRRVSRSTVCRAIARLGPTRKKGGE